MKKTNKTNPQQSFRTPFLKSFVEKKKSEPKIQKKKKPKKKKPKKKTVAVER